MMDPQVFKNALVLTGGGTGGHFFPAVALAEGALERWPYRPVVYVGAKRGIEGRGGPGGPWPHMLLNVEGFGGETPVDWACAAIKLCWAVARLKRLWREHTPAAVIGTGGYAAAPALLAARGMGIPYFLHESNAAPGLLTRLLASGARRVWCGSEEAERRLTRAYCNTVGTPVRASFMRPFKPVKELKPPFQLLVLGGSGGARAINEGVFRAAGPLLRQFPGWTILHQAGRAEYERLKDAPRHERHTLVPFIADMAGALEESSFVVCRAGAGTCAELKAVGRGALMIPLIGSAGNHQVRNAEAMAREGRVVLVRSDGALHDHIEAHCAAHMSNPYARYQLAKAPEPNRAVARCLADFAGELNLP